MIGIVQRPRRKKHLAVNVPGTAVWDTLGSCRLTIPVDGTAHTSIAGAASIGNLDEQDADVCVHCLHLIAFAHVLEQGRTVQHLTAVSA